MTWAIAASAVIGAGTSLYASNKQSKAADAAGNLAAGAGAQGRRDLSPWVGTGGLANDRLGYLLGLTGANGLKAPTRADAEAQALNEHIAKFGEGYGKYSDMGVAGSQADSIYKTMLADYQAKSAAGGPSTDPAYGSLTQQFTGDSVNTDPGYQFGLNEGQKSIDRAAAANGRYDSGQTLKALTRFGQDYAGTKFNEAFNRDAATKGQAYQFLAGQSGQGANAAGQQAGIGMNTAGAVGNYMTQGADAQAAGAIGATNALTGGVGNYMQYQSNQQTLDYLKGLRKGSVGSSWGGSMNQG